MKVRDLSLQKLFPRATTPHRSCLRSRKPRQLVHRCAGIWDREEQRWLHSPEHLGHTLLSSHYNVVVVNEFSVLKTKVIFIPDRNFGVTYTATLLLRSCVSSALKISTVSFGSWGGPVLSVPLICLCGDGVGWGWGVGVSWLVVTFSPFPPCWDWSSSSQFGCSNPNLAQTKSVNEASHSHPGSEVFLLERKMKSLIWTCGWPRVVKAFLCLTVGHNGKERGGADSNAQSCFMMSFHDVTVMGQLTKCFSF